MRSKVTVLPLSGLFIILAVMSFSADVNGQMADTDIRGLLSTLAKANGINLILGDSVKGTVSANLGDDVSPMEAMELILSANGLSMVKIGNTVVAGRPEEIKGLLPKLSEVVKLQYASATELANSLSGVTAGYAEIYADPRTNSIIITGTESGIQTLKQIIQTLDIEIKVEEPEEVPKITRIFMLNHAQASAMKDIVSHLSSPGGQIIVDNRTNSLLVTDTEPVIERLSELITQLDVETPEEKAQREMEAIPPPPPPETQTRVYNLNHLEAGAVSELVQKMLSPQGSLQTFVRQKEHLPPMRTTLSSSSSGGLAAGGGASGGQTSAEKWSDLLIVTDLVEVLDSIGELISKLDTKPPQVKIEAKIVELNTNDANNLGINWEAVHRDSDSTGETNFLVPAAEGVFLNLGTFTAQEFEDVFFRIQALETRGKAKIMFSPSVMTMDNEMAQMMVVDRIPILRTFETEFRATTGVEFINVGMSLDVLPHITEDDYIIMDVTPQADYIKDWTTGENPQPIISTRLANTRVRVKNNETFAISGLIKEEENTGRSGIPVLNRIPLLGRLFGASSDSKGKTDLIVFITPTIYRDNSP